MLIYKAKKIMQNSMRLKPIKRRNNRQQKKTEIGDRIKKKYKSMDKIKYI